jgi:hypothetical protein
VHGDSVTIRLEGEVEIGKLSDAFACFAAVLEELPRSHNANIRWVLAGLDYGSAIATARAVPLDDDSTPWIPFLADEFLEAARSVARGEVDSERPILRLVRELTDFADRQNPIVLETADDDVMFTSPVVTDQTLIPQPQTTKSLGTVRGRVETLSHRGELRFTLFELASDRPVSCYLPHDNEDLMRNAWGFTADVTGTVTRDFDTGRPRSIRRVTNVEVVQEGEPAGYLQARGVVRGSVPAETVIRRIRDAS